MTLADARGFIIAAPRSGAGKTVITLGLLKAFADQKTAIVSAKAGPDYLDPMFHSAATGHDCVTLDPWGMRPALLKSLIAEATQKAELIIVEGVMGLFDGAAGGGASTADLAAQLGLPIVLIVDVGGQSQSAAALVKGFMDYRDDCKIAGLILNKVSSPRHLEMVASALEPLNIPVVGALGHEEALQFPSRHLGLVQAREHADLDQRLEQAADLISSRLDLEQLRGLAAPLDADTGGSVLRLVPLGQHIAIARDEAFAFTYPHILDHWRKDKAQLSFFSPLKNEAPDAQADAIYLPGGYPELHLPKLAKANQFFGSLKAAQTHDVLVFGECGGYMVLGDYIIDADGKRHDMAGLLPLGTNFAKRKLHLGYRKLIHGSALPWPKNLRGHEFHYASIDYQGDGDDLFQAQDSQDADLGPQGLRRGNVMGSFIHILDVGVDDA